MKTEEKIHAIVDKIQIAHTYIYENPSQANVTLDSVEQYPVILNLPPEDGKIVVGQFSYNDKPRTMIGIIMPIDFDHQLLDPEIFSEDFDGEYDGKYDAVKVLMSVAIDFIDKYNDSGFFKPLDDVEYTYAYNVFDENTLTLFLEFDAEELKGVSFCDMDKIYE